MKITKSTMTILLCAAIMMIAAPDSYAGKKKRGKKKAQTETVDTLKKKPSAYEKLIKGESSSAKGMIDLHLSKGKVYFELPLELLGREFVMGSTIKSTSDNANAVVGSKPLELKHFTFTKVDSTINMRSLSADVLSNDPDIARALSHSNVGPIVKSFKVHSMSPDSSKVVFDVTSVFLDNDEDMSPFTDYAVNSSYKVTKSFKKELSFVEEVKSFEDNVSVTCSMSYTYSLADAKGKSVVKDKALTAELVRSILLLPEEIYHPRSGDYRIGVFTTERQQLASNTRDTRKLYYANRWNLAPSDTAAYKRGELVEPVKPIVYYIDSNFPEWWKPYIKMAVEQWQGPFEKIGFKNAIIAKDFPTDDPEFDPDNIKYSCIRYAPIGVQNAMGPSWVDPRSGEIINASVYVYHDIVKLINRWMFVQTAQADEAVRARELPQEVLGDALTYVIRHEVGHTLGFMHNMSASNVVPVESLRDPEFTHEHGLTSSIMDYARFNYVAQPGDKERGVKLTPPMFGEYDYWLVKWTYTPVFDAPDFEKESEITSSWITDALKKDAWYRYGKQQPYQQFFDPRAQTEDLGDDSVAASKYGVKNLKYITANFMEWLAEDDDDFENRLAIYNGILNQYLTYAQHVAMNVGGIYKDDIKSVDEGPGFANIPAKKQKEALDYLFTLWEDVDWLSDRKSLGRLPVVGSVSETVRSSIESMIFAMPFLAGYSDNVATQEFSSTQVFNYLIDKIFAQTKKGGRLTAAQREFQVDFVTNFMKTGNFTLPKGLAESAISEDARPIVSSFQCSSAEGPENLFGELMYSPAGGYEWLPRFIFNQGDLTMASIYAVITKVRDIAKAALPSANAEDKAHYQYLISLINYGIQK